MVTFVGARALAESKFKKKEAQLSDWQQTMAEHEAARRVLDANTVRLRALRLARDATEKASARPTKTPRTAKRSSR
jgi:hypothetical protein